MPLVNKIQINYVQNNKLYESIKSGLKQIDLPHFNSTSLNPNVSEKYAGQEKDASILLKIRLPKGCHCLDVSAVSTAPTPEEEILLPQGGRFKILQYIEAENRIVVEAIYEPEQ